MASQDTPLQAVLHSSCVGVDFWHALTKKKLEEYKLNADAVEIHGVYPGPASHEVGSAPFYMGSYSLDAPRAVPERVIMTGSLYNANTLGAFQKFDKRAVLRTAATRIWEAIVSGAATKNPALLTRFLLLSFADLKRHHFYYWFAFPAISGMLQTLCVQDPVLLSELWSEQRAGELVAARQAFASERAEERSHGFFLAVARKDGSVKVGDISRFDWFKSHADTEEVFLALVDPSSLAAHPGWTLRNYLLWAAVSCGVRRIRVICFRDMYPVEKDGGHRSMVLDLELRLPDKPPEAIKAVGWERNHRGRTGSRFVNLQSMMDPHLLAASSADLNLKLMKWRALPTLQLEKLAQTKCLLLGAGTLGCNVARLLLAWGIRHVTFVDNGRVSYSNPVRQSLYGFKDCQGGGKPKATQAAAALKEVFPGTVATGHVLTIPMPGHPCASDEEFNQAKRDAQTLDELVQSHDVVFQLTDSRESRWLPTLLCSAKGKLCINAALGFDTFVVLRHGRSGESSQDHPGCYFCSDVVAPANSLRDRTLDQQCTVTRPGLSYMASALAVELMVACLHQGQEHSGFGEVPCQIRGRLKEHEYLPIVTQAFGKCTACSPGIVADYSQRGFETVRDAMTRPLFLEDLTGLSKMKEEAEKNAAEWDIDSDSGDDF